MADVFTRFKGQSGESVKNTFIKPKMKAWTQEVTAKYPVTDVFGDKRQELNEALDTYLKKKFEPFDIYHINVNHRDGYDQRGIVESFSEYLDDNHFRTINRLDDIADEIVKIVVAAAENNEPVVVSSTVISAETDESGAIVW